MTEVMHTPPALRWVALFLAACAVLGLFLGFRDQIRKNPPGWYTGAEQVATPLPQAADGAREAVAFDPDAPSPTSTATAAVVAPTPAAAPKVEPPAADQAAAPGPTDVPSPPASTLSSPPRPKTGAAKPPARPATSNDPVGDILEGQLQPETPATVPY